MANSTKTTLVSLALTLLVMSTTLPKTNALVINGLTVNVLAIVGTCKCSPSVNTACETCAPLSNIHIGVKLNGNILASVKTASDGSFRIEILNVGNVVKNLLDISNLRVFVNLPILGCPFYATVSAGTLEGIPFLQLGSILNGVGTCIVPALSLVN